MKGEIIDLVDDMFGHLGLHRVSTEEEGKEEADESKERD